MITDYTTQPLEILPVIIETDELSSVYVTDMDAFDKDIYEPFMNGLLTETEAERIFCGEQVR